MTEEKRVRFLPLGALIQAIRVGPQAINIVQGFDTTEQYQRYNDPFFGETIGRVANRIKDGKIDNLNGRSYVLEPNNGPNTLHGGRQGWGKKLFDGPHDVVRNGKDAVLFTYLSKDGDEGFPGTVELKVWYTETSEPIISGTSDRQGSLMTVLEMEYEAELVGDENVEETAIGVTNHSYFNLGDASTIEGTEVILGTSLHQEVDDTDIPTGEISPFPGIEAMKRFTLGAEKPDVDHCFIVESDPSAVPVDTRSLDLRMLVSTSHPTTKIHLDIYSTEPAFQFYTGKYVDVPAVDGLPARGPRAGFCVEPSRYINAVNVADWRPMVILRKGDKFGSRTVYKVWQE